MAKPIDNMVILGTSGLKQSGGVVDEEWHPKLKKPQGYKTIQQIADNSSVIGAVRFLIRAYFAGVEFRVEPSSEDERAKEQAEFVESCLEDMSHTFEEWMSEALTFLDYGWAYFELVYKLRKGDRKDPRLSSKYTDGLWGWRKIKLRGQDTLERWEFDEDGGLRGMHQADQYAGKRAFIPIEKALLFRTENVKGNPEGRSLWRNCIVDSYKLTRIEEFEVVGIERDALGLLHMQVPIELLQAKTGDEARLRTELETMLSQLKRDEREFALTPTELDRQGKPTGYKLGTVQGASRKPTDINETKNYYRKAILQAVLAQFLELGSTNTGSWALASSFTNTFAVALGGILDNITAIWNRFAIPRLMTLNNVAGEFWPNMVHGDLDTPALAEIGAYITALAGAGQLPTGDKPLQRKLLEIASLPEPIEEEGDPEPDEPGQDDEVEKGLVAKYKKGSRRAGLRKGVRAPGRVRQLHLPLVGGI